VGLDEHTKGYRCYDPTSKKIIVTRDITFNKSKTLAIGTSFNGRETTSTFPTQFHISINLPQPGNVPKIPSLISHQELQSEQPEIQQQEQDLGSPNSSPAQTSSPGSPENHPNIHSSPTLTPKPIVYARHTTPKSQVRRSTCISKPSKKVLENYEFLGSLESQTDYFTY
jgi:hypothetical protein